MYAHGIPINRLHKEIHCIEGILATEVEVDVLVLHEL